MNFQDSIKYGKVPVKETSVYLFVEKKRMMKTVREKHLFTFMLTKFKFKLSSSHFLDNNTLDTQLINYPAKKKLELDK